jgi:hypothetical protein
MFDNLTTDELRTLHTTLCHAHHRACRHFHFVPSEKMNILASELYQMFAEVDAAIWQRLAPKGTVTA